MIQFNDPGRRPCPVEATGAELYDVGYATAAFVWWLKGEEPRVVWEDIRTHAIPLRAELVELRALSVTDLEIAARLLVDDTTRAVRGIERLIQQLKEEGAVTLDELFDGSDEPDAA